MTNINIPNDSKNFSKRTGLIFDDRMALHYSPWDPEFIENPNRYLFPIEKCKDYGLVERCTLLTPRFATEDELMTVHDKKYIQEIKSTKTLEDNLELEEHASRYNSVYFNNNTYECALLSAGCALELVSSVLKGDVKNGMAIVRPPGHHAMEKEACGFCYFNNVAIAAKQAIEKFNMKRILIVDWDVHHGQATQRTFYDDSRVLYFSIHRYEDGKFWPHLRESNFDFAGRGRGKGFNVNVPLNSIGQGNSEYLAIFNNVLLPIAYEYAPDLILISAGYDAALGCPEGEMTVYPQTYSHLLNALSPLAGGRICVILEGGYCIPSLSESVALSVKYLLGDPCPTIPECLNVNNATVDTILNVVSIHRAYWNALKLQSTYDTNDVMDTDIFDNSKHVVNVNYTGNPLDGVTVYETRNYFPLQQPHVKAAYADQIKNLLSKTDLGVTEFQTAFVGNLELLKESTLENLKHSGVLSKCYNLKLNKGSDCVTDEMFCGKVKSKLNIPNEVFNILKDNHHNATSDNKIDISNLLSDSFLNIIDAVRNNDCRNGFALFSSKDCKYNSVLLSVRYLIEHHKIQRVLVLDWNYDDNVQQTFMQDHKVLYVSLRGNGKEEDVGTGHGAGYTINIPVSGMTDGDYLASFFHFILPVAYEFSPEMVIVSNSFRSSHVCLPSSACIASGIKLLSSLCNGKLAVAYDNSSSSGNADDLPTAIIAALIGSEISNLQPLAPSSDGLKALQDLRRIQKKYWRCLKFDTMLPNTAIPFSPNDSTHNKEFFRKRRQSNPVPIPNRDKSTSSSTAALQMDSDTGDAFDASQYFCVTPLEYCPHLDLLQPLPKEGLDPRAPCTVCRDPSENWVCLHCYQVYCGRFVGQHMLQHGTDIGHYLTLSYSDLSVWCYACDAYIHNPALTVIKEHACERKFH